ncbi:MAG: hypothetical protein HYU53_08530 [Acidobacteria bacterium]|nr:hypothetical protein [Acidobacteriota bacterium]
MGSAPWWSGMARVMLAGAGLLGLFLAVDALFLVVLLVVNTLIGGDRWNPYAGAFVFVVVPAAIVVGSASAWIAYRLWLLVPRGTPEDVPRNVTVRT